jgi:hypothetical protein
MIKILRGFALFVLTTLFLTCAVGFFNIVSKDCGFLAAFDFFAGLFFSCNFIMACREMGKP